MKKISNKILTVLAIALPLIGTAFCGFYVAQAGAELFNNKSEVILVRDGDKTTITMSNDFTGSVKDFAMVIPVPNVLQREDIRVVPRSIFQSLDAYSAPRLVEYFDQNPCWNDKEIVLQKTSVPRLFRKSTMDITEDENDNYNVTIEAQYSVEEYEIIVLSAKESDGLKRWLTDNGYTIPEKAEEVLEPYIKDNLKFFVVKVNLQKYNPKNNGGYLRPIQIDVKSDRFMLPIRLGMANSSGEQDMIVYAFTKSGRIESTNYRTVKTPTGNKVPTFVKDRFGSFYKDLFKTAYENQGKKALFLEYAWNVTPSWGGMKCDPCTGNPPYFADLSQAGVHWANQPGATVFFTRLHVRYSKQHFPQDLVFQVTPNSEHFQSRYVLTHAAKGETQCKEASDYWRGVRNRRKDEILELASLTHWDAVQYTDYIFTGTTKVKENKSYALPIKPSKPLNVPKLAFLISTGLLLIYILRNLRLKLT